MRAGLPDPVFDAQAVFRAVLGALARPGLPQALPSPLSPPEPLTPELAAVVLALADGASPLWLDERLRHAPEVSAYLRFHTGAPLADDPSSAAFALVSDPARGPAFADFALGSPEGPDRSTTVILAVEGFGAGSPIRLAGPGVKGEVTLQAEGLPDDVVDSLAANRRLFPRGIDLLLVAAGQVVGLPRSTRVVRGDGLAEAA